MSQLKISFLLLFALFACSLAWAGGRGYDEGFGGPQGGQRGRGARGYEGGQQGQGYEGSMGRYGGQGSESRKYRSNLYSDDDVYGYDATYPNGEAAYINYRSKDARARRGPEFARTSRAYSRQGSGGERGANFGQMNSYRGGGGGGMW